MKEEIIISKQYLERLLELAKNLSESSEDKNGPLMYQEKVNHLIGYIYGIEHLIK